MTTDYKVMYKIFTFAVIWVAFSVYADWPQIYDSGNSDWGHGVAVDPSNNVIAAIHSETQGETQENEVCHLVKYDNNGNIKWEASYDSINNPSCVATDGDGNIFVGGSIWSVTEDFKYVTMKCDTNGNSLWTVTEPAHPCWDYLHAIACDAKGNVYVTGNFYTFYFESHVYTIKYDSNGNQQWARVFENSVSDNAFGIDVDEIGSVYIAGYTIISDTLCCCTIKYDSTGTQQWVKTRIFGSNNRGIGVTVYGEYIYVVGHYNDGTGHWNYFIIKYNDSGDEQWVRTYDTGYTDNYATNATSDRDGNILLTGYTNRTETRIDYCTIKYDNSGDLLWCRFYDCGNGEMNFATGIDADENGNVFVTGYTQHSTKDNYYDCLTVGYTPDGNEFGVELVDFPSHSSLELNIIPTISVGNFKIVYNIPVGAALADAQLKVYDASGGLVEILFENSVIPGSYSRRWNVNKETKSGIYFCQLRVNEWCITRKMVLIH